MLPQTFPIDSLKRFYFSQMLGLRKLHTDVPAARISSSFLYDSVLAHSLPLSAFRVKWLCCVTEALGCDIISVPSYEEKWLHCYFFLKSSIPNRVQKWELGLLRCIPALSVLWGVVWQVTKLLGLSLSTCKWTDSKDSVRLNLLTAVKKSGILFPPKITL